MQKEPSGLQQGEVLVGALPLAPGKGLGGAVIHRWIIQFKESLALGLSSYLKVS